ncbi:MAG: prepilin peptidase [Thermodesulfobacteriota bacterium]
MPDPLIYIFLFAFGAITGSFLNVCIYRIPLKKSIIFPPSSCPKCKKHIPFYDNIPIISYILLHGRCRYCNARIPLNYLIIEVVTALVAVSLFIVFGLTLEALVYYILLSALIVITLIDLEHKIIPDVISLPGIAVGFAVSFFLPVPGVKNSLIGMVAGGGVLFVVAYGYYMITGREGMGGGDIKLLAMIGAFLGWRGILVTLFVGSFVGAIIGGVFMILKGRDTKYAIPFGPFLSLGATIYLFIGEDIIEFYTLHLWLR